MRERYDRVDGLVRNLYPGDFAFVMATGGLSVVLAYRQLWRVSVAVLVIGVIGYLLFVVVYGWRLAGYPSRVLADVDNPASAFGYLTFVAASNVLSDRFAFTGHLTVAAVLFVVGVAGWLGLGYGIPFVVLLRKPGVSVLGAVNGSWLMWIVATQSVAVAAASLHPGPTSGGEWLALLAVGCWSVGVVLYLMVLAFIGVRLLSRTAESEELTPPYWILMGATAITVAAGGQILREGGTQVVRMAHSELVGLSLVLWAFGSWLVPMLLLVGAWRWARRIRRRGYDPKLWAVVFPVGMYSIACEDFGGATHLRSVVEIGRYATWVALGVWVVTFFAMLIAVARTVGEGRRSTDAPST